VKNSTTLHPYGKRRHWPLSLAAGIAIVLIAAAAIISLLMLEELYKKASRLSAAKSVIDQGAYISQWLSEDPYFKESGNGGDMAESFVRTAQWLQKMEKGVRFVSLSDNDVVLYRKQFADNREDSMPAPGQTVISRQKIISGTNILPVITFARIMTTPDGHKRKLEVALDKDIIERQSSSSVSALKRMFLFSMITISVAFAACLLAIIALAHREMTWQKRGRLNEHLAFAGAVAGSVIHDFRNPLSAMRLDAQLLQAETAKEAEKRPERLAELSGRIVRTIDRVDKLLAEFLTLSTPAKPGKRRETFDVNECVRDCAELLKHRFEKGGLNLILDLTPESLLVAGISAQFKRALLNIMTNAEQSSPPAGRVTIRSCSIDNEAVITIADEGKGIPSEARKKIFGLFYSTRPGGTGIGLALAKTAIENCGGEISVETPANGKGAAFVIKIPNVSLNLSLSKG